MQRLSVVIPNYNYARFVGTAIESALSVDWPAVEVVVVDDGSTDRSPEIIASFGERIRFVRQQNSGPRVACNTGFALTTGDVVIFLDSDDRLSPDIANAIARVWRPGLSKVQVQMRRIDADGTSLGTTFPGFRRVPPPRSIRRWMYETSAYPTPPGSGNAYARSFLEQLFPLDDRCGDATDSACLAAAPFLGDVVTIAEPLVDYRVHGGNRSFLLAEPGRFTRQLERARQRDDLVRVLTADDDTVRRPGAIFRGRHLLQLRVSERRLTASRPALDGDSRARMAADCVRTVAAPGPEPWWIRVLVSLWCLTTLCAPRPLARALIGRRFRQG